MTDLYPKRIRICCDIHREDRRRFLREHSYLICAHEEVEDKYVLEYYVTNWMLDFFLDPNRCRHLYSTSLVIDVCRETIQILILDPDPFSFNGDLVEFFAPTLPVELISGRLANATHLMESAARSESERHELLLCLKDLSEIHWFDIYNRGQGQRRLTNGIVHWVCTTLVG